MTHEEYLRYRVDQYEKAKQVDTPAGYVLAMLSSIEQGIAMLVQQGEEARNATD